MLKHFAILKKLKINFSLKDALTIYRAIRNENETIKLSNNNTFFLRKNAKDYETFGEVFIDNIYNLPLPINPKSIVDAGANIGLASCFFKIKYPEASIVTVEIDHENVEMIKKNTQNFSNVEIIKKGIYNKKGYFKVENPFNATNSFVITEVSKDEDYDVESITIPEILELKKWNEIDILKLDIEGAEKQLFSTNYENWLPKVNIIMIETHDRMIPHCSITVMKALDQFNFVLYTTTKGGTLIYYKNTLLTQ